MITNDPVGEVLTVLQAQCLDPGDVRGGSLTTCRVKLLSLMLRLEFLKLSSGDRPHKKLK